MAPPASRRGPPRSSGARGGRKPRRACAGERERGEHRERAPERRPVREEPDEPRARRLGEHRERDGRRRGHAGRPTHGRGERRRARRHGHEEQELREDEPDEVRPRAPSRVRHDGERRGCERRRARDPALRVGSMRPRSRSTARPLAKAPASPAISTTTPNSRPATARGTPRVRSRNAGVQNAVTAAANVAAPCATTASSRFRGRREVGGALRGARARRATRPPRGPRRPRRTGHEATRCRRRRRVDLPWRVPSATRRRGSGPR